MASGVPPADGGAGGVAGAGVCVCASTDELANAKAQAARLKETMTLNWASPSCSLCVDLFSDGAATCAPTPCNPVKLLIFLGRNLDGATRPLCRRPGSP